MQVEESAVKAKWDCLGIITKETTVNLEWKEFHNREDTRVFSLMCCRNENSFFLITWDYISLTVVTAEITGGHSHIAATGLES